MRKLTRLNDWALQWAQTNPWTNVYGCARSLLATGTLLTLLFNGPAVLFPTIEGEAVNTTIELFTGVFEYNFFLLLGPDYFNAFRWLAIAFLIFTAAGYYPRFTAIIHWWIAVSFPLISTAVDGGDQITANLCMLLIPICLLDKRKNHWSTDTQANKNPFARLIAISTCWVIRLQVAVIYLHAATGKFGVEEWVNGTAVYYWFNHTFFRMPEWIEPFLQPLLTYSLPVFLMTWGAMVFELILFLGLTMPQKQRALLLKAGLLFHFFILLIHGLISFYFAMAAALVLYLRPWDKPFNVSVFNFKAVRYQERWLAESQ